MNRAGVLLVAALAVPGAAARIDAASAATGAAPARLVGTYVATLTTNYPALGFYKGRYTLSIKAGNEIAFHILDAATFPNRARFVGSRVTLSADGQCTTTGSYTWSLRGKDLELRKLRDRCRARAVLLSRTWTKTR